MLNDPSRRVPLILGTVASALFGVMVVGEVAFNDEPMTLLDAIFEVLQLAVLIGCTVCCSLLVLRVQAQAEESRSLREDIERARVESQRWRQEMAGHLQELSAAIGRQFATWGLTAAEQEVGFLLLKGLSHKEIARLRRTNEATIRQQAGSIYGKAKLNGRAALSAFFLEDLLVQVPAELGLRAA